MNMLPGVGAASDAGRSLVPAGEALVPAVRAATGGAKAAADPILDAGRVVVEDAAVGSGRVVGESFSSATTRSYAPLRPFGAQQAISDAEIVSKEVVDAGNKAAGSAVLREGMTVGALRQRVSDLMRVNKAKALAVVAAASVTGYGAYLLQSDAHGNTAALVPGLSPDDMRHVVQVAGAYGPTTEEEVTQLADADNSFIAQLFSESFIKLNSMNPNDAETVLLANRHIDRGAAIVGGKRALMQLIEAILIYVKEPVLAAKCIGLERKGLLA